MKIVSLNIQHGGGKRIDRIIDTMGSNFTNCDIIILCEFRLNENGNRLIKFFNNHGYLNQYYNSNISSTTNRVFVASKYSFNSYEIPFNLSKDSHRLIKLIGKDFILYSVYFANHQMKKNLFEYLITEKYDFTKLNLIMGDFNTGLPYIDEQKSTFWGYKYFEEILNIGFTDCFRLFKPKDKDYSWFSNKGNGFRIDHSFISTKHHDLLMSCNYFHNIRLNGISDHSAIITDINDFGTSSNCV
jgi:exonuclease III